MSRLLPNILSAIPPAPQKYQMFLTVAPGLEKALAREISYILNKDMTPKTDVSFEGGFEVAVNDIQMWWILHMSRMCESARLRVGTKFPAKNFKQFESGLQKLPWSDYFSTSEIFPDIRVTCQKSLLYHTGAVKARVKDVVGSLRAKQGKRAANDKLTASNSDIHLRILNDVAQVSVDITTNEHYRRSGDKHVTEAPLRETIAAAILGVAGYKPGMPLWDPFMGSGTILLEALNITRGGPIAPPLSREFPMFTWPSLDKDKYRQFIELLPEPAELTTCNVIGSDISHKALSAAQHNLQPFKFTNLVNKNLFLGDFEAMEKHVPKDKDFMVVTNIPYGHRLLPQQSTYNQQSLHDIYKRFGEMLKRRRDLEKVYVLSGSKEFSKASQLPWVVKAKFDNRGLPVELLQLKR